jgi:hypothetical protein
MIALTADLHHAALGTENQRRADTTEIRCARRFFDLCEEARVRTTYFVSGRAFVDEWDDLRPLCESERVEIGGHTWDCFAHTWAHRASALLSGSYPGPRWLEARSVAATVEVARRRSGRRIRVWRNHMYLGGPFTDEVLAAHGIHVRSDGVRATSAGPTPGPHGVTQLPLNVMPDHEHLLHGERTPEWIRAWQSRLRWTDDYGPRSYAVEAWTELVIEQIRANERRGVPTTMLVHPITLHLADRMRSFERILDVVSRLVTATVSEVAASPRVEEAP